VIALEPETVRTARLALLPLRVEHAGEMAEVLSDPALHAFTGGAPDTACGPATNAGWPARPTPPSPGATG
jgi:hypothetical protein